MDPKPLSSLFRLEAPFKSSNLQLEKMEETIFPITGKYCPLSTPLEVTMSNNLSVKLESFWAFLSLLNHSFCSLLGMEWIVLVISAEKKGKKTY